MKLRYSEAFYSVQGEGKFVGVPSVFLRTFGCNFRCMNFGLKNEPMRDEKQKAGIIHNAEVQGLIDAGVHETTKEFTDLPIIHTGCDTYASIYPEFKHFNRQATVDEVVEHLLSLLPEGKWTMDNGQDVHLIMTGGEPLLAWQRLYVELFEHPRMQDLKNVTFETNTTQHLHDDLFNYLNNSDRITVTWSCSPKLSVSGEPWLTEVPGWNVQYILCQWADAVKNTPSTLRTWQKRVWREDGDSLPDYTYHSSEMPGGLKENEQLRKAMQAPINYEKIRKQL